MSRTIFMCPECGEETMDGLQHECKPPVRSKDLLAASFTPAVKWVLCRAVKLSRMRRDRHVRLDDLMTAFQEIPTQSQDKIAADLDAANAEVSEVAVADSTKTSGVRPPLSLD